MDILSNYLLRGVLLFLVILSTNIFPQFDSSNISYTPLHQEDVRIAQTLNVLVDSLVSCSIDINLKAELTKYINENVLQTDTLLAKGLISHINSDSNFLEGISYLVNVKRNWNSKTSKYFEFYYEEELLNESEITFWDSEYERLSSLFGVDIKEKVRFIVDTEDQYGRCFPPWDVLFGIKQNRLGDNPHELVHLFLFKYSDVPFFHEPLAFIYGTEKGDPEKIESRYSRYRDLLVKNEFISSTELLFFPQIIGLDDVKWASAFCFVHQLNEQYGLKKLLELMKENSWDGSIEQYKNSFMNIYGISLNEYENKLKVTFH